MYGYNKIISLKNISAKEANSRDAPMLFTTYQKMRVDHHGTIIMANDECNMKFTFWLKN